MDETSDERSDYISLKDLTKKLSSIILYFKSHWLLILILCFAGGGAGFAYANFKKPLYTASCTFVLDDGNKISGLGQFAGLGSLVGGSISGGGIFEGDNILELYKSRTMIEKALLCKAFFDGKKDILINKYITFNDLRKQWKDTSLKKIQFAGDPEKFNRTQDSIITNIITGINERSLSVAKLDKKLNIIVVSFKSKDEVFSKEFTNHLVETVNDFYVYTKTKKASQSVNILQKQADSVRQVLNSSISSVATAVDAAPNANPLISSLRVPSQRRQIDVQASTSIYGEIVKNLELAKISLRQETPLIQIIDQPVYPLEKNILGKVKGFIIGMFITLFLVITIITLKKIVTNDNL